MRVTGVDVVLCSFALDQPVRFGAVEYTTRDYVVVRVRTEDPAIVGFGAGTTRGTPLFAGTQLLAPRLIGADALDPAAFANELEAANPAGLTALVRPLSILEMALWDVTAKVARSPLYALLEGSRTVAPAIAVAGYFLDARGEEAILDELASLEAEGYRQLKLMLGCRPVAWMHAFLARAKAQLASTTLLAVDFHYSIPTLTEAIRLVRALDELELAFVEDPFAPTRWRELVALHEQTRTPLAAGEDVVSATQYHDLLEAVGILRVDPSTGGGFTAAEEGIHLAATAGAGVLPHGFAGANAELAGAFAAVTAVEVAPPQARDAFAGLMQLPFELRDGQVHLDDEPGAGLRLDWEGVVASAAAVCVTEEAQ